MTRLRLAVVGAITALGVAGCGDGDRGSVQTVTVTTAETSAPETSFPNGDAILIVTRVIDVKNHVGEIREFLIGEAAHCRGTGSYNGLRGGGSMVAAFPKEPHARGREIFTGTVGH
jgi:hypothetical protein